jgi:hypothetical protein
MFYYLRVVNENIDATEIIDGSLDDLITIFDGIVVSDGRTTSLANLFNDGVGSLGRGTRAYKYYCKYLRLPSLE